MIDPSTGRRKYTRRAARRDTLWSRAAASGKSYSLVYQRIYRLGWSEEDALRVPMVEKGMADLTTERREISQRPPNSKLGVRPNPHSLRQKALRAGIPYRLAHYRVKEAFWPIERALSEPVGTRGRGKAGVGFVNQQLAADRELERSASAST